MTPHDHPERPEHDPGARPASPAGQTSDPASSADVDAVTAHLGAPTLWRRVLWTLLGPVPLARRRDVVRSIVVTVTVGAVLAAVGFGFVKLAEVFGLDVVMGLLALLAVAYNVIGDLMGVLAYRRTWPQVTVWFDDQGEPIVVDDAVTDLVRDLRIDPDRLTTVAATVPEIRGKVLDLARLWNRIALRAGMADSPSLEIHPDLGGTAMLREHPRQRPWLALPVELFDASPSVVRWVLTHEAAHLLVGDHLRGRILMGLLDWTPPAATYGAITGLGLALLTGAPGWLVAGGVVAAVAATARIVVSLWSREREHAADAIAAHVLGQPLTTSLVTEFYERMSPGGVSPLRTHPTWTQRLDHLNDIRHALGLPHTDESGHGSNDPDDQGDDHGGVHHGLRS